MKRLGPGSGQTFDAERKQIARFVLGKDSRLNAKTNNDEPPWPGIGVALAFSGDKAGIGRSDSQLV